MLRLSYLHELLSKPNEAVDAAVLPFIKKLVLVLYQGELLINGQQPNKALSGAEYLLDGKRLMIDWSRLSPEKLVRFRHWLFGEHQTCFKERLFRSYRIDEQRAIPAEQRLSLWQMIKNSWLFGKHRHFTHSLAHSYFSEGFHLSNIDLCFGRRGCLVDLVAQTQLGPKVSCAVDSEHQDPTNAQNIKRVVLTDPIVDSLLATWLNNVNFSDLIDRPHPQSIAVNHHALRARRMTDFRYNNGFFQRDNWFWRLIKRITRWFLSLIDLDVNPPVAPNYQSLFENKPNPLSELGLTLAMDSDSGEIQLTERRPKIDTLVFGGGGAKIFAHVGAVNELKRQGIHPTKFVGSSAGAIMAMLMYLNYESEEIIAIFSWFRQENLMEFKIDLTGLSTTRKLKLALDWLIYNRLLTIIDEHPVFFSSKLGQQFLDKHLLSGQVITFRVLDELKQILPASGLGDMLSVTGTDVTRQRTKVFSYKTTPDFGVAKAVTASASLPVAYKPTIVTDPLTKKKTVVKDGGLLANFAGFICRDTKDSVIGHLSDADLTVLGLMFDNDGNEQNAIYSQRDVNHFSWLYKRFVHLLSGVKNATAGWVRDQLSMREIALQCIIFNTHGVSAGNFDLDEKLRNVLIQEGEEAVNNYLSLHFKVVDGVVHRNEAMYQNFENFEALLLYCAKRQQWALIGKLKSVINQHEHYSEQYKQRLIRAANDLLESRDNLAKPEDVEYVAERIFNSLKNEAETETTTLASLKCFRALFPILVQDWKKVLADNQTISSLQVTALYTIRNRLTKTNSEAILTELKQFFETLPPCNALLLTLLKHIVYRYEDDGIDVFGRRIKQLVNAFSDSSISGGGIRHAYINLNVSDTILDEMLKAPNNYLLGGEKLTVNTHPIGFEQGQRSPAYSNRKNFIHSGWSVTSKQSAVHQPAAMGNSP